MSFEILHFRDSDKIIEEQAMTGMVTETLSYLNDVLITAPYRGRCLRPALEDMGWRDEGSLTILENRMYKFKGRHKRIAIEANLSVYEFVLEGLLRLQIGYDQNKIDAGLLILTGERGHKSRYGTTSQLVQSEIEALYPTISLPVCVAVFEITAPPPEEPKYHPNGQRVLANNELEVWS